MRELVRETGGRDDLETDDARFEQAFTETGEEM